MSVPPISTARYFLSFVLTSFVLAGFLPVVSLVDRCEIGFFDVSFFALIFEWVRWREECLCDETSFFEPGLCAFNFFAGDFVWTTGLAATFAPAVLVDVVLCDDVCDTTAFDAVT
jgi:hypothetical protein